MVKITHMVLERVHTMPQFLEPGILYVSEEFRAAAHLCACGCGAKIRTPLGPAKWTVRETSSGPSLWPSVGNWQLPCRSHYVIDAGQIIWCNQWTAEQIAAGRSFDQARLEAHIASQNGFWARLWRWLVGRIK